MAIVFSATNVKIMVLNFVPNRFDLLANEIDILLSNENFFFFVHLLLVSLYKIEFCTHYLPPRFFIVIDKNFVKYSMAPVITPERILVGRRL